MSSGQSMTLAIAHVVIEAAEVAVIAVREAEGSIKNREAA